MENLEAFLKHKMPNAMRPGETPEDTAIRLLNSLQASAPFIINAMAPLAEHIVSTFQQHGFEFNGHSWIVRGEETHE